MGNQIKIKDIAKRAGVSSATVSMVLNNRTGIKTETRERILQIARTLEYGSEKTATLSLGTSPIIRFLRISRHGHVVNDDHAVFIANYIDGLSSRSHELGFNLEILTIDDGPIDRIIEIAGESRIKGCIVLGTELPREDIRRFQSVRIPVLFLDTYDEVSPFDFVDMNNKESVFSAVSYFVEKGHREIGMVTSDVTTRNFKLRTDAFREALAYFDLLCPDDHLFYVDSTFQGAYQDIQAALLAKRRVPPALFCANDIMALGTMKALKEAGMRIPQDVSLIGFDNLPAGAMSDPPITTIEVSKFKIGSLAAEILFNKINSKPNSPSIKMLVSGELIERSSVRTFF